MIEGKRFSHIVNPKTGYPVEEVPMAVTIIADDCTTADALATAVFVLGPKDGLRLLNGMPNVSGIVISKPRTFDSPTGQVGKYPHNVEYQSSEMWSFMVGGKSDKESYIVDLTENLKGKIDFKF